METYTEAKDLVENPFYQAKRRQALGDLADDRIDPPIVEVVRGFNKLPHCFTLQSCYGYFVYAGRNDPHNLEPLPIRGPVSSVEYRIAYIALCIEESTPGRRLLEALWRVPEIDPENVQFCCAEWFWDRQVNSYALQVMPERFKGKDTAVLGYGEALRIEKVRKEFFGHLKDLLQRHDTREDKGLTSEEVAPCRHEDR